MCVCVLTGHDVAKSDGGHRDETKVESVEEAPTFVLRVDVPAHRQEDAQEAQSCEGHGHVGRDADRLHRVFFVDFGLILLVVGLLLILKFILVVAFARKLGQNGLSLAAAE